MIKLLAFLILWVEGIMADPFLANYAAVTASSGVNIYNTANGDLLETIPTSGVLRGITFDKDRNLYWNQDLALWTIPADGGNPNLIYPATDVYREVHANQDYVVVAEQTGSGVNATVTLHIHDPLGFRLFSWAPLPLGQTYDLFNNARFGLLDNTAWLPVWDINTGDDAYIYTIDIVTGFPTEILHTFDVVGQGTRFVDIAPLSNGNYIVCDSLWWRYHSGAGGNGVALVEYNGVNELRTIAYETDNGITVNGIEHVRPGGPLLFGVPGTTLLYENDLLWTKVANGSGTRLWGINLTTLTVDVDFPISPGDFTIASQGTAFQGLARLNPDATEEWFKTSGF